MGTQATATVEDPLDAEQLDRIDAWWLRPIAGHYRERLKNSLIEHRQYVRTYGEDMPEVAEWKWEPAQCECSW
jgi:xylulose-5-phosphate/fructose-6-phosphate phosphoketolase